MRSTVVVALLAASCATPSQVTVRELPAGLRPLGELLHGCEHGVDADGAVVARCDGDVVFRVREVAVEAGAPPRYFGDGVDLANQNAGRMLWEQTQLPTAVDGGLVDRGEVRAVDDDRVVAVLVGAARKKSDTVRTESACSAPPAGLERCKALLTAFLDAPRAEAPARPTGAVSAGAIAGHALSLPTSCAPVEQNDRRGRYACDDGANLYWLVTDDIDAAAAQAEGAINAQPDADERQQTACALLDADTQCEETPTSLVGLGYLEGRPVVVVCVVSPSSAAGPWSHGLCTAAFKKQ